MANRVDSLTGDRHKDAWSAPKLLLAAAAGAAGYLLLRLISPLPGSRSVLAPDGAPAGPNIVGFLFRVHHLLFENFWLQLIYFVVFVLLAVTKRAQSIALVYAFIAGYAFPYILFHSLNLI